MRSKEEGVVRHGWDPGTARVKFDCHVQGLIFRPLFIGHSSPKTGFEHALVQFGQLPLDVLREIVDPDDVRPKLDLPDQQEVVTKDIM